MRTQHRRESASTLQAGTTTREACARRRTADARRTICLTVSSIVALGVSPTRAQAPDAEAIATDHRLEEVLVTAQRRLQNAQEVPIAVTALSADFLEDSNIHSVTDLKVVAPSVNIGQNNGYMLPTIRNVGSTATGPGIENPSAVYVDGVYYAAAPAALINFNNVAQIEVLKGPQGTLFGRNATAGVLQINTLDPKQSLDGSVDVSYGNYETTRARAYVTGGITDRLSADVAFLGTWMGEGYGSNLFNGKDVYKLDNDVSARSKWLFKMDSTDIRLSLDYSKNRSTYQPQRVVPGTTVPAALGGGYGGGPWDVDLDIQPLWKNRSAGISLKVDHNFQSDYQLVSISAYRDSRYFIDFDSDLTRVFATNTIVDQGDWQVSQEFQFLSPATDRVTWMAGLFYFRAKGSYDVGELHFYGPLTIQLPTIGPTDTVVFRSYQGTDSIAAFGQSTAKITDKLSLTAGLRYTSEKRTLGDATQYFVGINGATQVIFPLSTTEKDFDQPTWRLAVDYKLTDDAMTYVAWNRGFKSGGFNPSALTIPPFDEEILDAYEVGFKSMWLDNNLRFNAAAYYYDYNDVQIRRASTTGVGIYNAAAEKIVGIEAELEARLTPQLTLMGSYQYTPHAEYEDFSGAQLAAPNPAGGYTVSFGDASGNRVALTPRSVASLAANYTAPVRTGTFDANVSLYYNSGYFVDPDNVLEQKSYEILNTSLRWTSGSGFSVSLWGSNLTDAEVANIMGINTIAGPIALARVSYQAPRTYGVTVGKSF